MRVLVVSCVRRYLTAGLGSAGATPASFFFLSNSIHVPSVKILQNSANSMMTLKNTHRDTFQYRILYEIKHCLVWHAQKKSPPRLQVWPSWLKELKKMGEKNCTTMYKYQYDISCIIHNFVNFIWMGYKTSETSKWLWCSVATGS